MNISNSDNDFLNKKRKNTIDQEIFNQDNELTKKSNSAESKKGNAFNFFIAFIDPKFKDEEVKSKEKITGKDLNLIERKTKAIEEINSINKQNELLYIKNSLSYDNTNKYTIYQLLKYYWSKNDEVKYKEAINKYKFCITQKFNIFEGTEEILIDLNNFYKIDDSIDEYEEDPDLNIECENIKDLRNSIVSLFNDYYYLSDHIENLMPIIDEEDLLIILTVKITSNKSVFYLDYENDSKMEILNKYINDKNHMKFNEIKSKLLKTIEDFLFKYLYIKDFEYFKKNQPVSYKNNLTLYYNYIMYSLYELTVEPDIFGKKIIIKKLRLLKYNSLKAFHNIIFDTFFDNKIPFNETMNQLLQYLLFLLSTDGFKRFYDLINYVHLKEPIDDDSVHKLVNKLNSQYKSIKAEVENKKIVFNESNPPKRIEINYKYYSSQIVEHPDFKFNYLWENICFNNFQNMNFFLENDIQYLKFLIKYILSSPLYKSIFQKFSNVSSVADYYFLDEKNIDDYISRIIFLPYKVSEVGKYAITDRDLLSILVSGFPEQAITSLNDYRIYRIIELALRSVVLADHEPSHYIKAAYSIITERKISRFTSENDKSIDSGSFLEEVLFGWIKNENNPLDLSEFNLVKNIECKNTALIKKKIDLITALKLLDPNLYSSNLSHFRKEIYEISRDNLVTFSSENLHPKYKSYLRTVIDDKTIRESSKDDYSINASKSAGDIFIEYKSCNHNDID